MRSAPHSSLEKARSFLGFSLMAYAVLILGTQATMSVGAVVVMVGIALLWRFPKERSGVFADWKMYNELTFALAFSLGVSLLAAWLFPLSFLNKTALIHSPFEILKVWYLFWPPFLAWGLSRVGSGLRVRAFYVWLLVAGVVSAISVVQFWVGWPRPHEIPGMPGRFHATAFFGHHLSVASILIFPFFFGLDLFRQAVRNRQTRAQAGIWLWVGLVALLTCGFALLLTFSRTLWVALPIGVLIWVGLSLPRRWSLLLYGAVALGLFVSTQQPAVRARLNDSIGLGERFHVWEANWEFFKLRPVTGVGWLKNEELANYYLHMKSGGAAIFSGRAHNNILEMLSGTGLLGFFIWTAWLFWIALRFWRIGRISEAHAARMELPLAWGPLCAWIVFHMNGLTQVNMWEGKVLHQLMWSLAWCGVVYSISKKKLGVYPEK